MDLPSWAPKNIDINQPSAARVYDYILGGAHNFAVDRALGDQVIRTSPDAAETMRLNRMFLHRAVRFLAERGIRQYLDIGSGVPTVGNVHEIAQRIAPESVVVYVDVDPVAVAHSEAILVGNDRAGVICADLRDPDRILDEAARLGLIDFAQPMALLLAGVVHFLPDEDGPGRIIARLLSQMVNGSYLLVSHITADRQPSEVVEAQALASKTSTPMYARSHSDILALFDGTELVDPGLVLIPAWRPEAGQVVERPDRTGGYAGVGYVA